MTKSDYNTIEKFLSKAIALTWVFYFMGALYVTGPVIGWSLMGIGLLAIYLGEQTSNKYNLYRNFPTGLTVWTVAMFAMLIVLWVGHNTNDLGTGKTIKSTVGWAKGWALFPVYLFIGSMFKIRREVIIRAYCFLGITTLILAPIFLAAPSIGLPEKLYVSPFKAVGGPGPEFFAVYLYTISPEGAARWQFFTPWSPFAGLIGVLMVLICSEDKKLRYAVPGVIAGLMIVYLTYSRMSLIGVIVCLAVGRGMPLLKVRFAWFAAGLTTAIIAPFARSFVTAGQDAIDAFHGARANSTRVRSTLQRIARERWANEAIFFGHGTVEPGSHVVEYMPIGSHHTWFGLLFVKGILGVLSLALPMLWTLVESFLFALASPKGRLPLGMLLAILFFSFGENLEMQVYIFWPAMVLIGISMREIIDLKAKTPTPASPSKDLSPAAIGHQGILVPANPTAHHQAKPHHNSHHDSAAIRHQR